MAIPKSETLEARLEHYMGPEDEPGGRTSWKETFHRSWLVSQFEVKLCDLDLIQVIHAQLYHDAWFEAMRKHPGKRIKQMIVRFDSPVKTMSHNDAGELEGYYNLVARTMVEVD